jgi:hypothetical protein
MSAAAVTRSRDRMRASLVATEQQEVLDVARRELTADPER